MAPIIESYAKLFLIHNPKRSLQLVGDTAWYSEPAHDRHEGEARHYCVDSSLWVLKSRKIRKFIREKKERQELMNQLGLRLLDAENGVLLRKGLLDEGGWSVWQECRASDVVGFIKSWPIL